MAQFLDFIDMINGGGAGASGSTFQGGGLLSDIANAVAKPYGYRERMQGMEQAKPMARPQAAPMQAPMAQPGPVQGPQPYKPMQGPQAPSGAGLRQRFYQEMQAQNLDPATVEANPQIYQQLLTAFIRNGGRLPPLGNRPSNPVMRGF